jgi:glycosyltransferase involved in cell wall biosynthesis
VTVSILTPSYGYARFMKAVLASVEGQTFDDIEHVVVDGGSIDGTVDLLRESRVRWVSEPDRGQSDALNKAFAMASGEWIGWLNADEFYLPWAVETLMAESDGADVIYGDFVLADAAGRPKRLVAVHEVSPFTLRNYGTTVPSCSVLIRREVLGETPWDVDLKRVMDWDLWLRLQGEGASFRHVPRPIGVFRDHGENVTATPATVMHPEYRLITDRYGLHRYGARGRALRAAGRAARRGAKIKNGGWFRERRFVRRIGTRSIDWTVDGDVNGIERRFSESGCLA